MKKKVDCLLIGHNEMSTADYEKLVRAQGVHSNAYRDWRLSLTALDNRLFTAMDTLNYFRYNGRIPAKAGDRLMQKELSPAIAYLATYLHRCHFSYDFVNSFQDEKEELTRKFQEYDIRTAALTTTLCVMSNPLLEIISFLRTCSQTVKIILGGPFMLTQAKMLDTESLNALFKEMDADFYVIESQGESALVQILDSLKQGLPFHRTPNIVYKENGHYKTNAIAPENNPLEDNMVDWNLFPPEVVGDFISIRTSISCPFSCAFCGFPQRAGKYRYIDVDILEPNLNRLNRLGTVKTLHFIDDTFNVPPGRFKEILRMMKKNSYRFKWNSMFRVQYADEETLALMKESGCQGVFLGIESGSDHILKNMNKQAKTNDYRKGIQLLHQYGIITYASFIIGFPGETADTAMETKRFIEETRPTFFRVQPWYCDPITPVWQDKDKYKIRGSAFNWEHRTMNSTTASALVEDMFLSIKHSTWLPQYKFEPHNMYYLLNEGMSLQQVKEYLHCFNRLAAKNLQASANAAEDEIAIIKKMMAISKFKREKDPLLSSMEKEITHEQPTGDFEKEFDFD